MTGKEDLVGQEGSSRTEFLSRSSRNMVGHFLKTGQVGAVVTGADRIAANGDTLRRRANLNL